MRTIFFVLMMLLGIAPAAMAQSAPKGKKNCEATLRVGNLAVTADGKDALLYDEPGMPTTERVTRWWRGAMPAKVIESSGKWVKIELQTTKTQGYVLMVSLCRFIPGAGKDTPPSPAENKFVKPVVLPPPTGYIQPTAKSESAKVAVKKSMPSAAAATPKAPPSKMEKNILIVPVVRSARVDSPKKKESYQPLLRKIALQKMVSAAKAPAKSAAARNFSTPKVAEAKLEAGGLYAMVEKGGQKTLTRIGKAKDAKQGNVYTMYRTPEGGVYFVDTGRKVAK